MKLDQYDPSLNFWAANPAMKMPFQDVFSQDRSRDKQDSSKLMWGVVGLCDPNDYNPFSKMEERADRLKDIRASYWDDEFYERKQDRIKECADRYDSLFYTSTEKQFAIINEKISQIGLVMGGVKINTLDDVLAVSKAFEAQEKNLQLRKKLRALVAEEKAMSGEGTIKGGNEAGLLESGDI